MTVLLVEGPSDRVAVEALARRLGRDLEREGVSVVEAGGAHAIGRVLADLGPGARVAGLYDAGEEEVVRRALARAGHDASDLEALGFYVCVADLEDELIRAVGAAAVERVAEEQGDLNAFRTLQKQPEWRGRPVEDQLRRWLGSGGRRKLRYAELLVDALEPANVPRPLARLLDYVGASRSAR